MATSFLSMKIQAVNPLTPGVHTAILEKVEERTHPVRGTEVRLTLDFPEHRTKKVVRFYPEMSQSAKEFTLLQLGYIVSASGKSSASLSELELPLTVSVRYVLNGTYENFYFDVSAFANSADTSEVEAEEVDQPL